MMTIAQVVLIVTAGYVAAVAAVNQCCSPGVQVNLRNRTCADGGDIFLQCYKGYFRLTPETDKDQFWTLKNGTVMLHDGYGLHEYCMTSKMENGKSQAAALICYTGEHEYLDLEYLALMIISVPFLVVTILVYAMIPVLRDINGKPIIGYVASLTVCYLVLITRAFQGNVSSEMCAFRGAILYYSIMSMFAWLNVVTFNLWTSLRNKTYNMTDRKLFFMYLAWSVGLPLFLSAIVVLLDLIPGSTIKGHFGIFDCLTGSSFGLYALMFTPMTILIVLNIIMFLHCCWVLWRDYRDPTQGRVRFLRFKFRFTIKLLLLSGIPWIVDVISLSEENQLHHLWFIFDCINSAQGIILFIILVACHKRVLRAIHQHRLFGLKWPDSWNDHEADSVTVSEVDKVAMEQIKQNNA